MKNIITILTIMFAVSTQAQLTVYGHSNKVGLQPEINYYGVKADSSNFDLTIFAAIDNVFAEALVGFTYTPNDWLSIGFSSGIENTKSMYRFGSSLWIGKGKNSFLLLAEKGSGSDNYWYKGIGTHELSDKINLGFMVWRFQGIGPMVEYKMDKFDSKISLIPTYDVEFSEFKLTLGTSINF